MRRSTRLASALLPLIFVAFLSTAVGQSPRYFTISGEVRDEFGQLSAGVMVCAFPDISDPNRGIICGQSDEKGRFIIRLTKPGKYGLFYNKASDGYMSQNRPFYRHAQAVIPEVNLSENAPDQIAQVTLSPKNGAVTGSVRDALTNLAVEDVQITMCQVKRPEVCFATRSKNSKGRFEVLASPVPFTLKIAANGYEEWFGIAGSNDPIQVASGSTIEVEVYLKRREGASDLALNEAEKRVGVNLPAPGQRSPKDATEFNRFPRATKLEWEPVEGAVSYSVEIDVCQGGLPRTSGCKNPQPLLLKNNPPTTGIASTSYDFYFIGAQPGRWRVWAVDKEGREGFKSPWSVFIYLR
jgi:hypothetical protein